MAPTVPEIISSTMPSVIGDVLPKTMLAAVLYGQEDVRIEQVPVPHAGPGELIVRVSAALTCGTDLKVYRRGYHEDDPAAGAIRSRGGRGGCRSG
jgi:hypothetical protein